MVLLETRPGLETIDAVSTYGELEWAYAHRLARFLRIHGKCFVALLFMVQPQQHEFGETFLLNLVVAGACKGWCRVRQFIQRAPRASRNKVLERIVTSVM